MIETGMGSSTEVEVGGQAVPLSLGHLPRPDEPEFREFAHYEDGQADRDASRVTGPHEEPWCNVVETYEPGIPEALESILGDPIWGKAVRGRVVDLGAGTCWAAARLSLVPEVEDVCALDLSPRFLRTVGARVFVARGGDPGKLRFVASSFERTGLASGSVDVAFLIAAIHHALAPIKVLREVRRILSPSGVLFMIETPAAVVGVEARRRNALVETRESGCTEVAYTRKEFEYLIGCGGLELAEVKPLSGYSKRLWKRAGRKFMRAAGVEHLLLPACYLFVAQPEVKTAE